MFGRLAAISLAALLGLAFAVPAFDVEIEDRGFSYYSEYDAEEISDHAMERIAYMRLSVAGNGLTMTLSDTPFEGAIAQTFTEIPALDSDTERKVWGKRQAGESFFAQRRLQSDESERVHSLIGLNEQSLGWAITHPDASLGDVIAAYLGWFDEEGVTVESLGAGGNAASYRLTTDDLNVRVVFAQRGGHVRVYFQ